MAENANLTNSEKVKAVIEMVDELQEMLTSAGKVKEAFDADLKEMRSRVALLQDEHTTLQEKLSSVKAETDRLGNPEREIEFLEEEVRTLNQKIRNLMLESRGHGNRIKELELTLDQDEKSTQKSLGELENLKEKYYALRQQERAKLEENIAQITHQRDKLQHEIQEIDDTMNSLGDVSSTMDEVVAVLSDTVSSAKVGFYKKDKK